MTVPRVSRDGDPDGDAGTTASSTDALELELVEGGSEREVTDENKREYVALVIRWTLLSSVQAELAALMAGLYEVVPRQLLRVFDYQELELLLCGLDRLVLLVRCGIWFRGAVHLVEDELVLGALLDEHDHLLALEVD